MRSAKLAVAGLFAISAAFAQAAPTLTVTDLPLDRGGTVRVAHMRPDAPRAHILLLTGGDGVVNLMPDGIGNNPNFYFNTPFRVRPYFVDRGYSFTYVDAPSDKLATGMTMAYRASTAHLSEIRAALNYVRQRDDVPVWVWGFSAGSVSAANMALNLSSDPRFGVVLLSPATVVTPPEPSIHSLNLEAIRRPVLVTYHVADPCPGSPPSESAILANRFTGAPVRGTIAFTGGSGDTRPIECDSTGHHGLGGQDEEFAAKVVDWTWPNSYLAQVSNYTSLWWNAAESGWGVNLNHQGDILFGTLFTYDASGAPMWLVLSAGRLQSGTTYSGDLYRTTGPAFNANPFTPITEANLTKVGTMTVAFAGADAATLTYSVNGVSVTKAIQRQVYGSRAANCMSTAGSRSLVTNYQDLWWNPAESGWGVNVTHQGDTLFATLFTYDATGKGLWLVMSAGQRQADGSYLGDLLRTTGPAFNANPFTPIGAANLTTVGTMRFRFSDGNNGTLSYTYNGVAVTKAITRQTFAATMPSCF